VTKKRTVLFLNFQKPKPKKKIHYGLMFIDLANLTGIKRFTMFGETPGLDSPKLEVEASDFSWAHLLLKHIGPDSGMVFPVKPTIYAGCVVSEKKRFLRGIIPEFFKIVFYKKTNADIVMATDIVSLGRDFLDSAKSVDPEITIKIFSGDYDFIYPVMNLMKRAEAQNIPFHVEVFGWKGTISSEWEKMIPSCKVGVLNYCRDYFFPSMQQRIGVWNEEIKNYEGKRAREAGRFESRLIESFVR